MGRLVNGPNGPIVGKVGKIVGSSLNGKHYIKGPYKRRTKKISEDEQQNRNKFGMGQLWIGPLLEFIRVGFKNYPDKQPHQAALSHLLNDSFEGEQPNIYINPSLVKVSYGDLPLPANISVAIVEEIIDGKTIKKIRFTWDATEIEGINPADQVMMLVYNPETTRRNYKTTGQLRSTGSDTLSTDCLTEDTYHVYCAFVAHDRSRQSHSVYLGTLDYTD